MADKEGNIIAKDYGIGIKPPAQTFHVKGLGHAEWGMKTRLSHIFAEDGRTIMLAFDHGYIMGSTAGLERLDLAIPPLMEYADCLMATRGALRACIPPDCRKAIALRCTADTSVLKDDMSHGVIGVGIEDAIYIKQIDTMPGKLVLKSMNPAFPPVEVDMRGDLAEQARILGQILWVGREYR